MCGSRPRVLLTPVILLAVLFLSCSGDSPYPADVQSVLDAAGDNRAQLEQVLEKYSEEGDSLKLQAACFLIGNMEGHGYATYDFVDSSENVVIVNALDYPDYDSLLAAVKAIETERGELDYKRHDLLYDSDTITADFLLEQIDYAFRAWREKPWAKTLSPEDFRNYVLPYRGSNEPLEPWREMFWKKYLDLENDMTDPSDPIEAAALINNDIRSWFGFDPRFYFHPTDQGLTEMLDTRLGRCEDMTNITIYAMRANGLAVTSDFTPYWADAGNNHAWNAIVRPDGSVTPFMGAEANPGEYQLANKLAKVYRKTFAKQKDNLAFQENKQEEVPGWLAGKSYIDVTADYVDVCDVTVAFEQTIPDSVNIAYLCVFNSGEWKAIHWGRISDNSAVFTDMGADIAYLPALYLNKEIVPFGTPFILSSECDISHLQADTTARAGVNLLATTHRVQAISTDGVSKAHFETGKDYELFYWEGDWKTLGKTTARKGPLSYPEVPQNGLYWLVAGDSDREERIFTLTDGKQTWW